MRSLQSHYEDGCHLQIVDHPAPRFNLFFVHGLSLSSDLFEFQLRDERFDDCRLVAFNLPEHGRSGSLENPDQQYSFPGLGKLLARVSEQVCAGPVIYVGHSLGAHLLIQGLDKLPDLAGLLFSGCGPLDSSQDFSKGYRTDHPGFGAMFQPEYNEEAVETVSRALLAPGHPDPGVLAKMVRTSRPGLRTRIANMSGDRAPVDEVQRLAHLEAPLAILHGELDQSTRLDYLQSLSLPTLWHEKIEGVDGAGHCPMHERPDEYNRLLRAFIDYVV